MLAAGTCTVTADQAGDGNYTAAPQASQSFDIARAAQTITLADPADIASFVANQTVSLSASASSGLPVTLASATPSICSVSGTTATVLAAGTCTVTADQAGDGNYTAAPQASQSFDIARAAQTITLADPADIASFVANQTVSLSASASSGLPVTLASATPSICSVSGTTATVLAAGTCTVTADQAGDGNYTAAPQASQSFDIARAAQTITLTDPADIASFVANQTVSLSASASSGLPVTLASGTPSICSVSGTTATVLAAGTCTVTADQAGDGNYTAAPQASQSFDIARAAQTITFTSSPPTTAIAGGADYAVSATGGASSSAVIFSIDSASTGICTIAGNLVSFTAGGACIVNADQAGDGNYSAAPRASQTIAVGKQAQTISFTSTPPSAAVVGPVTYTVAAMGGASGNPVLFSVAPGSGGICAISGSDVSMIGAGNCTIHADQAGSPVYAAAPQAQQSFAIAAAQPSFTAPTLAPGVGAETLVFEVTVSDGTGGMTTDTVSITIRDTTAPTVVIAGMPAQMSMGVSVPVTFTFSEPVTGFAQGDVAVSNAALSGFAGSGAIYTAMLRADGRGAVGLSVPAAAADDMAGNANLASQLMSVPLNATAETEELLAKEAVARGRALLSSQPDLSSLLSGTGRGGAMVSRGATGMTFDINTDPDSAIWLGLSGRWGLGEASTDRYVHGVLGAHLLRSSDLILGAMLQADHGETKDGAGKVEADGWLIGPYFAKRFGEDGLILSGSYLAGETDLAINPIGAYTDKVTSERQVLTLSLMDEIALETMLLRPRLDLARVIEDRPSYIDGLGNRISASDLTLTEASAGLDFEVPIFVPSGLGWVSGGLSMIHDLEEVDGRSDRSTTRGRIDFGLLREYERGGTLDFSASYDGIGAPERGSIGLALLYSFQF